MTHRQHAVAPIYCALPPPSGKPVSHFPPPASSVPYIPHRFSSLLLLVGSYFDDCPIFSTSALVFPSSSRLFELQFCPILSAFLFFFPLSRFFLFFALPSVYYYLFFFSFSLFLCCFSLLKIVIPRFFLILYYYVSSSLLALIRASSPFCLFSRNISTFTFTYNMQSLCVFSSCNLFISRSTSLIVRVCYVRLRN